MEMIKPIDDYGELRCPECNAIIRCNDCGDMPERCPGCGEVIDYSDYEEDEKDELLKILACFGCPYCDECEDEWEDGHSYCDEMIEKTKSFVKRTGILGKIDI